VIASAITRSRTCARRRGREAVGSRPLDFIPEGWQSG
jgi:hypothetical protein